jgi:molecular chaperone HtpG
MGKSNFTAAERAADKATSLEPFSINLSDVRRNIELILGQIGKGEFFEEFTLHNYQHVHDMLQMLDWLIPDETKKTVTPAEWLLLVLSIYLHDVGLLVTREEFENRGKSDFQAFCNNVLFTGESATDYRAKIEQLPTGLRDRVLYQEYVRYHHGKRVRNWIEGKAPKGDPTAAARTEIQSILARLDESVRRDWRRHRTTASQCRLAILALAQEPSSINHVPRRGLERPDVPAISAGSLERS